MTLEELKKFVEREEYRSRKLRDNAEEDYDFGFYSGYREAMDRVKRKFPEEVSGDYNYDFEWILNQLKENKVSTITDSLDKSGLIELVSKLEKSGIEGHAFLFSKSAERTFLKNIAYDIHYASRDAELKTVMGRIVFTLPDEEFPQNEMVVVLGDPKYLSDNGVGMYCLKGES